MESNSLTIENYLKGSVRNIDIPDNSLMVICAKAEVDPSDLYADATQKQRDLALAYLYVWLSDSISQSGGYTERSADWQKSENSERVTKADKDNYLNKAKAIFKEYGIDVTTVIPATWGFVGRGFRNIRRY